MAIKIRHSTATFRLPLERKTMGRHSSSPPLRFYSERKTIVRDSSSPPQNSKRSIEREFRPDFVTKHEIDGNNEQRK